MINTSIVLTCDSYCHFLSLMDLNYPASMAVHDVISCIKNKGKGLMFSFYCHCLIERFRIVIKSIRIYTNIIFNIKYRNFHFQDSSSLG